MGNIGITSVCDWTQKWKNKKKSEKKISENNFYSKDKFSVKNFLKRQRSGGVKQGGGGLS